MVVKASHKWVVINLLGTEFQLGKTFNSSEVVMVTQKVYVLNTTELCM